MCTRFKKKHEIVVKEFGHTFTLPIKFNEKIQSNYNHGQTREKDSVTDCDGRGHIKHYTFETYMQQVELKVNADNKKVQNPYGFVLPCSLTDGGCESIPLDPFAYTGTQPSNCLLSVLFQNKAKMVKYLFDPTPAQYYIVSDGNTEPTEREKMYGRDENSEKLDMKFRIYMTINRSCVARKEHCTEQILIPCFFLIQVVLI